MKNYFGILMYNSDNYPMSNTNHMLSNMCFLNFSEMWATGLRSPEIVWEERNEEPNHSSQRF